jgi:hypothetical protein
MVAASVVAVGAVVVVLQISGISYMASSETLFVLVGSAYTLASCSAFLIQLRASRCLQKSDTP